jgi:hypothetical protein
MRGRGRWPHCRSRLPARSAPAAAQHHGDAEGTPCTHGRCGARVRDRVAGLGMCPRYGDVGVRGRGGGCRLRTMMGKSVCFVDVVV